VREEENMYSRVESDFKQPIFWYSCTADVGRHQVMDDESGKFWHQDYRGISRNGVSVLLLSADCMAHSRVR
jgi:hypothetical protein